MVLSILKIIDFQIKYVLLIAIVTILLTFDNPNAEYLDATSNEAVQNVGAIYNASKMTVTDLDVTGTLTAGKWKIRNDRIGIPERGDMELAADQWVRLKKFDGGDLNENGFCGNNLYTHSNLLGPGGINISGNIVTNNGNLVLGGANSWIFHNPKDPRKTLFIAPGENADNWNWAAATELKNNGTVTMKNKLRIDDNISVGGLAAINTNKKAAVGDFMRIYHRDGEFYWFFTHGDMNFGKYFNKDPNVSKAFNDALLA